MKIRGLVKITLSIVAVIVVVVIAITIGFCVIPDEMMSGTDAVVSYTDMGCETLSPAGMPSGHALVVYDPTLSGATKKAATKIAADLLSKEYAVTMAGVRSPAAGNVSGYGVVVIGGPAYGGELGSSARSYLRGLNASPESRVGVYATGWIEPKSNDSTYLRKFVTSLPDDEYHVRVDSAVKLIVSNNSESFVSDVDTQCSNFVAELLQ